MCKFMEQNSGIEEADDFLCRYQCNCPECDEIRLRTLSHVPTDVTICEIYVIN